MKTILAHWKKDLLSTRSLFIVWGLCVGLIVAFAVARLAIPSLSPAFSPSSPDAVPKAMLLLFASVTGLVGVIGLQFLLLALLLVRIVHLDPLVDPEAWWRTRPISGLSLLAAKGLSAAVLLAGAFLSLGAMGLGGQVSPSACLTALSFVTGLVAFASLTTGLSSLILHWLAIAISSSVLARGIMAVWQQSFLSVQGSTVTIGVHASAAANANSVSISLLYVAGFLAAIFCQYLKRSKNLSIAILLATFFLAGMLKG